MMNSHQISVLLADDHDVVRTGMRAFLEKQPDWHVCAEAADGKEAVRLAAELQPDVVILDLEMSGGVDGVTVTRLIKQNRPQTEVLIFTMHDNEYMLCEAIAAGARTFVLKSEGVRPLMKAVESALERRPFLSAKAAEILRKRMAPPECPNGHAVLTGREREIVRSVASGRSNKETAIELGISVKTVETHRATIMRKLGFTSTASLVRYALRERFIEA
jgi:DNA-binding NarL/FixJ family response regulator